MLERGEGEAGVVDGTRRLVTGAPVGPGEEPLVDQMAEGVVGHQRRVGKPLHCDGACEVAAGEPPLDAGPVVGLAGAEGDRVGEQVEADGAPEQVRDAHRSPTLRKISLIKGTNTVLAEQFTPLLSAFRADHTGRGGGEGEGEGFLSHRRGRGGARTGAPATGTRESSGEWGSPSRGGIQMATAAYKQQTWGRGAVFISRRGGGRGSIQPLEKERKQFFENHERVPPSRRSSASASH